MQKRLISLAVLLMVVASACSTPADTDDRPLVVVTTTILGDIVARTAGETVRVEVLMPIGADPHEFSPSARQAARLRDAALVVANGVDLEEGLLDVIEAAESDGSEVIRIGELLDPQPFFVGVDREGDSEPGGVDDASHDNGHGLDPHVWMDPVRMADAVTLIAESLKSVVGVDVSLSAAGYKAEVLEMHEEIAEMIEGILPERRKMVTNHFSYGYFADRYGLELLGTVIPSATTGSETSAADFAALIALLEKEQVSVVFGSTTEPTTLADALADEVGYEVKVVKLYTGSLGEAGSGAETYLDMMRSTTGLIVENLS